MASLIDDALAAARIYLGAHEQGGENRGPEVDLFLASVGALAPGGPGRPWCAAFLHYVFAAAARAGGRRNPFPRTASSQLVWTLAEPICRVAAPAPGVVYVLRHNATQGHVGIVETVDEHGAVDAEISGNTFAERGGRAGNCVARHHGPPERTHGGELRGYLDFARAWQPAGIV